jgi:hypothetical protein
MQTVCLSPKLLLIAIPSSIGLGMTIWQINGAKSPPQIVEMPTEWKIQTVEAPKTDKKSIHQAFLDRQQQLKDRSFSCDCNGCRVAAAQIGIRIN